MPKYLIRVIVIGCVLLLAAIIYFLFSPAESTYFPQCPFHRITGFDCPGCGSQRAIHHLLHFRLKDAFASNPLLILAIPYLIIGIYFEYFGGKEKYPTVRKTLFGKRAIVIVLILIVLFWIGRNISFS